MLQRILALATVLLLGSAAQAQVTVTNAWVRGTATGQKTTGAFMTLSTPTDAKLVDVQSPAAAVVEVHEMVMDNNVMKMRAVPTLTLPAGKPVEFTPGGYHVMLIDLKQPLKAGDSVPLTLVVEGKGGKRETLEVKATVRALGAPAAPMDHKH